MWQQQVRPHFCLTLSGAARTRVCRHPCLSESMCLLVPDRLFQQQLFQPAAHVGRRRPCLLDSMYLLVPDHLFLPADPGAPLKRPGYCRMSSFWTW